MDNKIKVYDVSYDDGEKVVFRTYYPEDVEDIEYHQNYITIKYSNGVIDMMPWQTVIKVTEHPEPVSSVQCGRGSLLSM